MIVADTNLIAYLLIPSEHTAAAEEVRAKDDFWLAPPLWRSELRNVLALYVQHGKLALGDVLELAEAAEAMMRGREVDVDAAPVLRLAAASGCSAYDCEFVVLAQAAGVPLVTSDRRLLAAFPTVAVSPTDFAA
ncbi:MAG TPA: type II toxin-antitoxin system VapC family toxin [Longimicrobiaceae bacterium]|nr:type II toxin-antitoxin system VapC family toxin [Longimicrobiaceae bacterium]